MKSASKYFITLAMILVFGGILVLVYTFVQKNTIGKINGLKSKAKKEYLNHEFVKASQTYRELLDSMEVKEEEVSLNYAHASLLSSHLISDSTYTGMINGGKRNLPDSTLRRFGELSLQQYQQLTGSSNDRIASIASNQLGFTAIKSGNVFDSDKSDSIMSEALSQFKLALKKDPSNDSARYNYELLKKIVGFPETIIAQTKSLVAQRRYKEAVALLENAMKRDKRLRKQQDFLARIKLIVAIDSIKTKSTL
jgi:tetratricopeptide (TPR) repeat protein